MAKGRESRKNFNTQKAEDEESDSSEEIDEDLAFNSEDERKYGYLFLKNSKKSKGAHSSVEESSSAGDGVDSVEESDNSSSDGIATDDDDGDGDGGQYMLDLLKNLDNKTDDNKRKEKSGTGVMIDSLKIPESEFSSAAVKNPSLTLDQLMSGITSTKGFNSVKETMKDMTLGYDLNKKRLETTKIPVAKVLSERAERKVHYEEQSEVASQWIDSVKQNREAETLDFRPKDRIKITRDELVGKFQPSNDFEKEIAMALQVTGTTDEMNIMKREEQELLGSDAEDDLGYNKLSIEEFRKRKGELAKMRALMFYEERKRHHTNKIKSKKYRKIRKKQRLREKEKGEEGAKDDEDLSRKLEERAEMERMKERMSLRHKNASKWAKRVLRRGGAIDMDTRRALSEQLRIGDDLRKKMIGTTDEDDDGKQDLLQEARNILTDTQKVTESDSKKGIFQLAFMKKGMEAQRTRAKEEARQLLRELQVDESEKDCDDDYGCNTSGQLDVTPFDDGKKKKLASSKELETVLGKGKLVAKSLEFGNSNRISLSGAVNIDVLDVTESAPSVVESDEGLQKNELLSHVSSTEKYASLETIACDTEKRARSVAFAKDAHEDTAFNSWLQTSDKENGIDTPGITHRSHDEEKSGKSVVLSKGGCEEKENHVKLGGVGSVHKNLHSMGSKKAAVNVEGVVNCLSGASHNDSLSNSDFCERKVSKAAKLCEGKITTLSQDELVRRAFVTPGETEAEKEFVSEKDAVRDRDDHSKRKLTLETKLVAGWGCWTGDGTKEKSGRAERLPKRLQNLEKRKRNDDNKKNVIINAKRMKKTAKFMIENIPHPYDSREQYERGMSGALGAEWNVTSAVKNLTRPAIVTRAGKMIRPLSKKVRSKKAVAKF